MTHVYCVERTRTEAVLSKSGDVVLQKASQILEEDSQRKATSETELDLTCTDGSVMFLNNAHHS